MNKRQPTFLQSDDAIPAKSAKAAKTGRTHILDKANTLSRDIASLDDPNISQLYNMLTTELQGPSKPTKGGQSVTASDSTTGNELAENRDPVIPFDSKASTLEVATYVHNMTTELKNICLKVDLKFLAYLVDMARVEASSVMAEQACAQKESASTGTNA